MVTIEDSFLYLDLPDDVVHADDADGFLLLVGNESCLSLDPGVATSFGEEAVSPCLALPLWEYCNKMLYVKKLNNVHELWLSDDTLE